METQQDMIFKKDGEMMIVRFGELRRMEDMVMTLSNGTRVAMDGTLTLPDGSSRMLMDGEALTLDGEPTTVVDQRAGPGGQDDSLAA